MLSAHHARRFDALQRRCPDGKYTDGHTSEVFLDPSRRPSCSQRAGRPHGPRDGSHDDVETRRCASVDDEVSCFSAQHVSDTPSSSMEDVGYVECPSCNRNFSDRAADRHIAWCQERKSRIPKSPASAEAVERLKARTKSAGSRPLLPYYPLSFGESGERDVME
ncbi:hypothetical protein HPB51_021997 [Rhipicephalus microplus]|uniref:C2HC/C3H-type domain-containing protein n=1 Tax=Rhipicephalus microplus TaxID=6941 RepID=A0A9J6DJH1_RHIMP|nr:hypothetical protein HPB51_021997 [Rhipicephalus microplus]